MVYSLMDFQDVLYQERQSKYADKCRIHLRKPTQTARATPYLPPLGTALSVAFSRLHAVLTSDAA